MVNNDLSNSGGNVTSIVPLPVGHVQDTTQQALLRTAFGTKYANAYAIVERNRLVFDVALKALELFPETKVNMVWFSEIFLGMDEAYGFLQNQPPQDMQTEFIYTEKEWALTLLQKKLYRRYDMFASKNRPYARLRLPDILIHIFSNGDTREYIVTNMEELVQRCMTLNHDKYESEMKVMFFIAANVVHNLERVEDISVQGNTAQCS